MRTCDDLAMPREKAGAPHPERVCIFLKGRRHHVTIVVALKPPPDHGDDHNDDTNNQDPNLMIGRNKTSGGGNPKSLYVQI